MKHDILDDLASLDPIVWSPAILALPRLRRCMSDSCVWNASPLCQVDWRCRPGCQTVKKKYPIRALFFATAWELSYMGTEPFAESNQPLGMKTCCKIDKFWRLTIGTYTCYIFLFQALLLYRRYDSVFHLFVCVSMSYCCLERLPDSVLVSITQMVLYIEDSLTCLGCHPAIIEIRAYPKSPEIHQTDQRKHEWLPYTIVSASSVIDHLPLWSPVPSCPSLSLLSATQDGEVYPCSARRVRSA